MNGSLSCSAINCVHNIGGLCSADTIHIMGKNSQSSSDTMCNTFAEKGMLNSITNLGNMNIVGEFKQLFNNDSVEMFPYIKCDAVNCIFNKDKLCNAEGIQITGSNAASNEGTKCETFKKM